MTALNVYGYRVFFLTPSNSYDALKEATEWLSMQERDKFHVINIELNFETRAVYVYYYETIPLN